MPEIYLEVIVRLIGNRRRGPALLAVAIMFALSGTYAVAAPPPDHGSSSVTAAVEPEPGSVVPDTALIAEPSNSPTTLSRGSSSVTVSKTADLTRQALDVSWTGMTPMEAIGGEPAFPVVVMQCRGSNPSREDCWMAKPIGGFHSGPFVGSSYLPVETSQWLAYRVLPNGKRYQIPFRKADGTYHAVPHPVFPGAWTVLGLGVTVPTSTVDDYTPGSKNARVGITRPDGTGEVQTWSNTKAENPSLGCSNSSPCSLVVVPVQQHPCRKEPWVSAAEVIACAGNANSKLDAGLPYWQLLANWYQRYVFKLSFAPASTTCQQSNNNAGFLGSELMAEAMRRWVPARCQQSSPAGLDYTRAWEPDSRRQLGLSDPIAPSGFAADAAVVTEPSGVDESVTSKRKPAYAPVGISGFAIGYNWEKSEGAGGGPVPGMKLNARLVAKLLTQSYPGKYRLGSSGEPANPNAATNPSTLIMDPEFQQLNPGAVDWVGKSDGVGTQMAIPVFKTDVMMALTRWIWSDASARAFMQGKADPWGMTVNKSYRGWQLPRDDYELNDGWLLPKGQGDWTGFSPQALGAQSTNSWANGTDMLMTAWPLSQYPAPPPSDRPNDPIQPKREFAQDPGFRHVMAVSTTSELAKAGMRAALLQNSQGDFVGPNVESMTYALDGAVADQSTGVWRIDPGVMDKRGYPGTMISYAEVPTSTLKAVDATRYADTLRWMSTDAQQYGQESGQLPDGYLALTEPMRAQTAKVALAVENQTGTPPIPPKNQDPLPPPKDPTPNDPQTPNPDQPGHTPGQGQLPPGTPSGTNTTAPNNGKTGPTTPVVTPSGSGTKQPVLATGSTKPVSAITKGESLGWLAWGLPALLLAGLLAGVASPGIRLIAQPGHPVRRGISAGGNYVAGLLRRGRRRNS